MRIGILIAIEFGLNTCEILHLLFQVTADLSLVGVDLTLLRVVNWLSKFGEVYRAFIEVLLPHLRFIYKLYFLFL